MTADMGSGEAGDVAVNAYIYLYPLVTMETSRQQPTSIELARSPAAGR
jgi:hypothetical protein